MRKLQDDLTTALRKAGIQDGMRISFHHHLRNGDGVLNLALEAFKELKLQGLCLHASAFFDVHLPVLDAIKDGRVHSLECNYMSAGLGRAISGGLCESPVIFRSHGGRAAAIAAGAAPIDIAILAAPCSDPAGNLSGIEGPSACGALGYCMPDAAHAKHVIAVTDHLVPYPYPHFSIPETQVDQVVCVEAIGDPAGIVSGTTQVTRDPVGLLMADLAADVISASGLLQDGFSFQTGAGGASLATAHVIKERMQAQKIQGSFGMGGITSAMVEMLETGCFESLLDVQCFDLDAVTSLRGNPGHREISALHYAAPSPFVPSSAVDNLDCVILGATEMNLNFDVNVHSNAAGQIMGGAGGHLDTAAGSKLAIIIAPLIRARMPLITDSLHCISTPGHDIDVLVTPYGIAVNPKQAELAQRLKDAKLPLSSLEALKAQAEKLCGTPQPLRRSERLIAKVEARDGSLLSSIYQVDESAQ